VKPDERVAICVERVCRCGGAAAILKAGGRMCLGSGVSGRTVQYMLEDSGPVVLLTQQHLRGLFRTEQRTVAGH